MTAEIPRRPARRGAKGEIDLVGYDGETLAIVDIRARTAREDQVALPELSVTARKAASAMKECPVRFGVVAIEEVPGKAPVVGLHKNAFSPQM